ncbi:hypothetical protein FRB90_010803 [Tulasnella sp. 427]|nr:hypothetical protein FRB90_010803 [Tulasnella sp. 427]
MRGWLESTAKPVRVGKKATDTIQTLAQSGAGLIDVYKAVHGQTIVTPTVFALNDTAHHHTKHTITVKNTSKKSKKYTITHVPAGTMMSFDYQQLAYPHPVPLNDIHRPLVTFKQKTITVKAGKEGKFDLEILPPNRLDRQKFPVYSGFFKIATSDESVQVAYMGVAAKMKDLKIFDRTNQRADHPVVRLRRDAGTREQRIDLVRSDYKLSMSLAKYPALGQIGTSRSYIGRHAGVDGDPNAFEDISNGTSIPPGNYRLLLRALKITGNPKTEADYDAWLSPIIDVEATP